MKKIIAFTLVMMMLFSLTACGSKEEADDTTTTAQTQLNLENTYTQITSGVEMPDMYTLDAEQMLDLYGIRQEYCNQAVVYICVNSLRADEIWLLEAKDADSLETLKGLVNSRIQQKDAESATYDPEQNAIVKAAQIIEAGNYLVMIVSPDADAIAAAFRTAAGI